MIPTQSKEYYNIVVYLQHVVLNRCTNLLYVMMLVYTMSDIYSFCQVYKHTLQLSETLNCHEVRFQQRWKIFTILVEGCTYSCICKICILTKFNVSSKEISAAVLSYYGSNRAATFPKPSVKGRMVMLEICFIFSRSFN